MDLKWEYFFKSFILNNLIAKLKTSSNSTILSVYKNRLGYSTVVSPQYSSFIQTYTVPYSVIASAHSAMGIPYSIENQAKYACIQIEKNFYTQRDNIFKLLS